MMGMREKLIELLCEAHNAVTDKSLENDSEFGMTYAEQIETEADSLIANGVTIQQWIPVTERLPKEDGSYLVRTAPGTVTTARFYAFKSFPATKYLPAIHRNAAWQSNRNVTHWMPLPEAPNGERRTDD